MLLNMITTLNSHVELLSLLWLFPIVFMFHDFEEILTVENWVKTNQEKVLSRVPVFVQNLLSDSFKMNTLHFSKDVFWIYTAIVLSTILAVFFSFYYLFLAFLFLFFIHGFTHLGQAAWLRSYTPGVITTPLLVLPYSLYAYYRLLAEEVISSRDIIISSLLMLGSLPFFLMLLKKGRAHYVNPKQKN
ncbi:HXXEE domain-containing protein [Paenibacillus senegalensis]|uniref:HXXEE domain-containing protein n=1 Tax=Paenibacillus senegalensis TaxID=1465766 RepID=UPI0002883F6F|nr:HXXEE domain-containing protein [Paenibacillus senegalensis]